MKLISFIIFLTFIKFYCCEFFSSTAELKNLENNEQKLIELLKDFVDELDNASLNVKKFLTKLNEDHALMARDINTYLFNPLNSFLLIKRLSNDIDRLEENFKFLDEFFEKSKELKLPTSELDGAIEGLYRLQTTYDLKSEDFVRGIIEGKDYGRTLSAFDLLVIAQRLVNLDEKYADEFIEIAKELSLKLDKDSRIKFLEQLFDIHSSIFDFDKALEILDEIKGIDPHYLKYDKMKMETELALSTVECDPSPLNDKSNEFLGSHWTQIKEDLIFSKACQQKLSKSAVEMSQLHCRYISKTFFTKIAPFKIIEANLNPYIVIYVDIISDKEIEVLKNISAENLQRASVLGTNSSSEISKFRIAKLSWPEDWKHKIFSTLTNRVNDMTGLNMATAERWQIQNYGIGGFYTAHHDFASQGQEFNDNNGNRIATMLFYLSDVEKGGGTVFPLLRIYVPPVKGTAAFWYNLSSSGNREYLTRHSGCPVLIGSKWVANKWIREYGQEFTRPCELEPKLTERDYSSTKYDLKDYEIKV